MKNLTVARKQKQRRQTRRQRGGQSGTKDVVLFHANWCGHCKGFMPTWKKVKKQFAGDKTVNMTAVEQGKMDMKIGGFQNKVKDGQKIDVGGFPTIAKIDGGKLSYYQDERTPDKFAQWIRG
jgi:thiol-disulfide isomerase/thioredoxin